MLPGKRYKPEDFLWIAWTRKWLIVIPTVLVGLAAAGWAYSLPDRFRSSTTILVVPQRVPESYVRSTVTSEVSERLQTISQLILSRTKLERLIEEFKLYESERSTMIMEDVVERMRLRDIRINVETPRGRNQDTSQFSVSFESSDPRTAQRVAERLATMFVQENLEDRSTLADSTNSFLQAQLEDARRRLIEHEQKLAGFRAKHSGRLPSQLQSNLQMMQTAQAQLQANSEAASRERDRLGVLELALAEGPTGASILDQPTEAQMGAAAAQLENARAELRNMELRLKPQHPDIARAKRTIIELEQKAELEAESQALREEPTTTRVVTASNGAVARLEAMQLEAEEIRRRLESRRQQEARLHQQIASFTARVDAAPALESEVTELMRDYTTLQEAYTSLLRKSEDSKIAANLERRQIGEQFRIIDPATLPERPFSPDRLRLNVMGILGGFGLGLFVVALLEYRDTTFKSDQDIVVSLALPVIAVVPAMVNALDVRQRRSRRRRLLAISASLASVVILVVVVAWRLRLLEGWAR